MTNELRLLIDKLVPRGGTKPETIYVNLEEYLSRLANFNRKIAGIGYRIQTWRKLCEENKTEFDKRIISEPNLTVKFNNFTISLRDSKLENEFEMLLYSISTSLSSITRIIACFLKGATQSHGHSGLSGILSKYRDFNQLHNIVVDAWHLWGGELKIRRDAATHYIALSATSFIHYSKNDSNIVGKSYSQLQIPKYPAKQNSLWEDELPTLGGSKCSRIVHDNGNEFNQLMDNNGVTIITSEQPLKRTEFIEAETYVDNLCTHVEKYFQDILNSLLSKLKSQCPQTL